MRYVERLHRWLTTSNTKLYFVLVFVSIIPLILFLYSADRLLRTTTLRRLDQQTVEAANLVHGVFEQQFAGAQKMLEAFATRPSLVAAIEKHDTAKVNSILQQAHELFPQFSFVSAYDTQGTLNAIYPSDSIVGQNFRMRDWYKGVSREWRPYISELYKTAAKSNQQVVAVAVPVKDEHGKAIGILMAPFSASAIQEWQSFLTSSAVPFIDIVDRRGNPIIRGSAKSPSDPNFEPVRRVLAGETGHGRYERSGVPIAAAFKPIHALGGGVIIAVPLTEVPAAIRKFERPLLGLAMFFVLIAVGFGSMSAGLSRRLRQNEKELEQKNLELELRNREVERANDMKSQFLASMSHELRTPLNAILGFSQLLAEGGAGKLNEKQTKWVEHVRKSGKHLLQLINDILDLAKIESGRVEFVIESFVANAALPEVISNIRPLAMAKHIRVVLNCDPHLVIQADRLRFKQVLYNLLSNAIKFTNDGGEVRIEASAHDGIATFVVADTGIGIRPEDLGVIFEEFRQVGADSKEVREGTGLGLAITKRLLEQQHGAIRVESEVGVGTRFLFTLPQGNRNVSDEQLVMDDDLEVGSSKALVLVVDDDPAARELMVNYLTPEGYATAMAGNGAEAVELARKLQPDAITLDILMPSGSGWEILYTLRNDPTTARIPIIVVSIVDHKNLGMTLGAADYLVKPIDKTTLLDAVQKHIAKTAGAGCRCVAADDDPETLKLMSEVLAEAGCNVRVAKNGKEALDVLRAEHTDLLLLDLMMPEMDGFEVIRQMDLDRQLTNVPVIVLTAKTLTGKESAALARSTQALLHKHDNWRERLLVELKHLTQQKRSATAKHA